MKMKRWMTLALSGVLVAGTLGYGSAPVKAEVAYSTDYAITIPATLNVQSAGWNDATIEVKLGSGDEFDTSKKLTVTAASANGWKLKSENNDEVGYNLATTGDTYNAQAEPASWEFAAGDIKTDGTVKPMGIIVEDYSTKPAGTYQDTVTFTAKVENAVTTRTVTWNASDITDARDSFTKDGITITARMIDDRDKNFMGSGTFTTESGKFTKIEVTAAAVDISGTGWSGSNTTKTWTGDASSSVSYSNNIMDMGRGQLKIVFTIEE